MHNATACRLSVLIPFHDEAANVAPLWRALRDVLDRMGHPWEAVLVDDGSGDGTFEACAEAAGGDSRVALVRLPCRAGQTAAIQAALDRARGEWIVTLDGDGQNDPADLPRVLLPVAEGLLDFAVGWRRLRKDPFWRRVVPSRIANAALRTALGVPFHDIGCGLRAFRRECLASTRLSGQVHRVLPAVAFWRGARVGEVPVGHLPRRWGRAKYGLARAFRIGFDLAAARRLALQTKVETKVPEFVEEMKVLNLVGREAR